MRPFLHLAVTVVADSAAYAQPPWLDPSVREFGLVTRVNWARGCPPVQLTYTIRTVGVARYVATLRAPRLAALRLGRAGQVAHADPADDAYPVLGPLKRLIADLPGRPGEANLAVVPDMCHDRDGRWRPARALALSRGDFPRLLAETWAAPTVVMVTNERHLRVLTHELMHLLVDLPRHINGGDEHVEDGRRILAGVRTDVGTLLDAQECARVRRNSLLCWDPSCDLAPHRRIEPCNP